MPAILASVLFLLLIIFIFCLNTLDKWRFRADRQYPYVRELMNEWEAITLQLLSTSGSTIPPVSVSDSKHAWQAVSAANKLAAACQALPQPDFSPVLTRQGELEEELDTFLVVYNNLAQSFNKALKRPVVRQFGSLFHWEPWEPLNFNPDPKT